MLLTAAATLLLMPALLVLVQVLAALLPRRNHAAAKPGRRPRLAVLIPAHDEAGGLARTVAAIKQQLVRGDRMIVVADNCSDDTASVAAAAGAEVVERVDPARRGKGYALDFGARHLELDPPEVVVVVDADCTLGEGALDTLARTCERARRPAQALYRMQSANCASVGMRVAELAWILKNWVRPLGWLRLGLPCQLMGTGMALPWPIFRRAPHASACLVEDLALGLHAARNGAAPLFCPDAVVQSHFPSSADGRSAQRARWEHGHLATIMREAPRLFAQALVARNWKLMALVADVCVPPLALLGALVAAVLCVALASYAWTGSLLPALLAATALTTLVVAVVLAWGRFAREVISPGGLFYAGVYALAKIPLYARFLGRRQLEWVRAERNRRTDL
jgi:cellulose synthase/poly-beta-1,6-N-acetylglucosamine synthase-like glycosyltransferase